MDTIEARFDCGGVLVPYFMGHMVMAPGTKVAAGTWCVNIDDVKRMMWPNRNEVNIARLPVCLSASPCSESFLKTTI